MEYILFIHNNTESETTATEWESFFEAARKSGLFLGGSEIANRTLIGRKDVTDITKSIAGFMRFESDSIEAVKSLLGKHPVLIHGGTLELCEMPKTQS